MPVDEAAARRAIADRIAAPMGLSVERAALGIIHIAVANMSRAIRAVCTERGHDARDFALFAYGGAGPLHAAAVAVEVGMNQVLVPVEPGTMCARGILLSDVSLDLVRSEIMTADESNWPRVAAHYRTMRAEGAIWLDGERIGADRRRFDRVIDARYQGQNHEVQVRLADDVPPDAFAVAFAAAHRQEYGYDIPGRAIEVVNCRLTAVGLIDRPKSHFAARDSAANVRTLRHVYFDQGWKPTPIYDRASLGAGARVSGPAVIDEMSATTLLPPGCVVTVDASGNLLMDVVA
jgi:N-methylhydantoinase A